MNGNALERIPTESFLPKSIAHSANKQKWSQTKRAGDGKRTAVAIDGHQ